MKVFCALIFLSFLALVAPKSSSSSSSSSRSSSEGSHSKKIHYHYILWFGDDVYRKESISLTSPKGIFFIDAMNQAAAKNSKFEFEGTDFPGLGTFIDEIGGVSNGDEK